MTNDRVIVCSLRYLLPQIKPKPAGSARNEMWRTRRSIKRIESCGTGAHVEIVKGRYVVSPLSKKALPTHVGLLRSTRLQSSLALLKSRKRAKLTAIADYQNNSGAG
jgi:hypothetical protein